MYSRAARVALLGVVAATMISAACATKINNVLADPSRYRDREVTVSGLVTDSFSLLGRGAYQIEDRTARLWVISDRGVPRQGARVKVTGTIREAFNLGLGALGRLSDRIPTNGLVMLEREHRAD